MKIGLIADTHLPRFGRGLPAPLVDGLGAAGVTRLLHAGDFTGPEALGWCRAIAPVDAVAGNNDGPELHALLGRKRIVTVEGVRIGLAHGDWPPGRARTIEKAVGLFEGDGVDVVCYGHSHVPGIERRGPLWVVNPGSPTDKRRQPRYSYAVLTVEAGRVAIELRYYDTL